MTTIAVMQPYFIPYGGYFQLFAAADMVVLFDCVQFPRRGWAHRNYLGDDQGEPQWLTLPLAKQSRGTLIRDLRFADDADALFQDRSRSFAALRDPAPDAAPVAAACHALKPDEPVMDYLERTLKAVLAALGLSPRIIRSTDLNIDPALKAQDRILAICEAMEARRYINASNGVDLYSRQDFAGRNIDLRFLTPFTASNVSILQDLHDHGADWAINNAAAYRFTK